MCLIPKYFSLTQKQREFACRGKRNSACAIGKNLCILFLVQESYSTRKTWPCRKVHLALQPWLGTYSGLLPSRLLCSPLCLSSPKCHISPCFEMNVCFLSP